MEQSLIFGFFGLITTPGASKRQCMGTIALKQGGINTGHHSTLKFFITVSTGHLLLLKLATVVVLIESIDLQTPRLEISDIIGSIDCPIFVFDKSILSRGNKEKGRSTAVPQFVINKKA